MQGRSLSSFKMRANSAGDGLPSCFERGARTRHAVPGRDVCVALKRNGAIQYL